MCQNFGIVRDYARVPCEWFVWPFIEPIVPRELWDPTYTVPWSSATTVASATGSGSSFGSGGGGGGGFSSGFGGGGGSSGGSRFVDEEFIIRR